MLTLCTYVATEVNQVVSEVCLHCCVSLPIVNKQQSENLWSLETIGIKDPLSIECDDEVLDKFCKKIQFKDGRYHITWPWREGKICFHSGL